MFERQVEFSYCPGGQRDFRVARTAASMTQDLRKVIMTKLEGGKTGGSKEGCEDLLKDYFLDCTRNHSK